MSKIFIFLILFIIFSCSQTTTNLTNETTPPPIESIQSFFEVIEILKTQYYPNNLFISTINKLNNDKNFTNNIINSLSNELEITEFNNRPILISNISQLNNIIDNMEIIELYNKYYPILDLNYLMNNPIYEPTSTGLEIYRLLDNNDGYHNQLLLLLEDYLLNNPQDIEINYAQNNLKYLKSVVFKNDEVLTNFTDIDLLNTNHKDISFGVISKLNNNFLDVELILNNSKENTNYIIISDPIVHATNDIKWSRVDFLSNIEPRYLNTYETKAISYKFVLGVNSDTSGLIVSLKLDDVVYSFPVEVNIQN